jgi:integrase/recombinase XerD
LALNGVRLFYLKVLEWPSFDLKITLAKGEQRIPELLSQQEVARILAQCANTKHQTMLMTCYACGLRVSELVNLRVSDIDGERQVLRVTQGKGAKDRMVLMGSGLLRALRSYWRLYRPTVYLFCSHRPQDPLNIATAQKAFTRAKRAAGIRKVGGYPFAPSCVCDASAR